VCVCVCVCVCGTGRKQLASRHRTWCYIYSLRLLMMDRQTVRNT